MTSRRYFSGALKVLVEGDAEGLNYLQGGQERGEGGGYKGKE